MVQLLAGFQLSQALYAAARLGIADRLRSGPQDAAALAAEVGADAPSLRRVLRTLASIGVFTQTADGRFGLAPLGETLTQDSPASMRDLAIMWMETHYGPFGGLLDTVRTGRCAATTYYGKPFFSWLSGHPEQAERFSHAMANLTNGIKLGAIGSCDFTGAGRIVLHDWSDAEASRLLANIKAAAPAGARLIAFELVVPDGAEPHMAKMIDMTMMGMLNGRERTQAEYRTLLEQAGFTFLGVTGTPTPVSIITALA